MNTTQAISIIVSMNTLPPQIDCISHREKIMLASAEEFIVQLPPEKMAIAIETITQRINEYFESGAAYYDSLF